MFCYVLCIYFFLRYRYFIIVSSSLSFLLLLHRFLHFYIYITKLTQSKFVISDQSLHTHYALNYYSYFGFVFFCIFFFRFLFSLSYLLFVVSLYVFKQFFLLNACAYLLFCGVFILGLYSGYLSNANVQ